VFESDALFLQIAINGVTLGSRQRIMAVPFAIRTTQSFAAQSATGPLVEQLVPPGTVVAFAGVNAAIFHRFTARSLKNWDVDIKPPPAAAIAGVCSILLWLGVIAGGRLIAYV
jgi:hypothetical protein